MSNLLAGIAIGDVTPPAGIDVTGFCSRLTTRSVHRTLRVSSVFLSDGDSAVCIVACDLLGLTVPYAARLKAEIADELGLKVEAVAISCSHTHSAPALSLELKIGGRMDEWDALNETYERFWRAKTLATARLAAESARPARLGVSRKGTAEIGVNRRVWLPNGRMIVGRAWDRPVDHSVGVVRIDALDGSPICTLFNYACHPITLGPEAEIISPDYPGMAREILESISGAPAIFLQGAGANIAPVDGMGPDPEVADRLGRTLGLEAAKVWSMIETRNVETAEVIVESYNLIASLVKTELPPLPARVRFASETIDFPLQPGPSLQSAQENLELETQKLADLEKHGALEGRLNIQRAELRWARYTCGVAGQADTAHEAGEIQVVRVNDWLGVFLPVEPFVGIQQSIFETLGHDKVFVCGYSNGVLGYLPMPEDYPEGGYEVLTAHHVYLRPAALSPEVADLMIVKALQMASALQA